MEDDRVSSLEQQLAQAKLIAEEADKKYEEVGQQKKTNSNHHPCPNTTRALFNNIVRLISVESVILFVQGERIMQSAFHARFSRLLTEISGEVLVRGAIHSTR